MFSVSKPYHMGTNHMLGQNNYVPLMQQNFEVRIYDNNDSNLGEQYKYLTLSTNAVGAVRETQDIITVEYGNGIIKFPNKVKFDNVTWTLNCFCEPSVLDALRAWRRLIFDPDTEKMGLPSEYMKQVYFIKYDGQGNVRDVIECPGTWIGPLNNGEMRQEGGIVTVTVDFIISKAKYWKSNENLVI